MKDNPGTPRAMIAKSNPRTMKSIPPQKFLGWPIFM
jgi:hypothetical protein